MHPQLLALIGDISERSGIQVSSLRFSLRSDKVKGLFSASAPGMFIWQNTVFRFSRISGTHDQNISVPETSQQHHERTVKTGWCIQEFIKTILHKQHEICHRKPAICRYLFFIWNTQCTTWGRINFTTNVDTLVDDGIINGCWPHEFGLLIHRPGDFRGIIYAKSYRLYSGR